MPCKKCSSVRNKAGFKRHKISGICFMKIKNWFHSNFVKDFPELILFYFLRGRFCKIFIQNYLLFSCKPFCFEEKIILPPNLNIIRLNLHSKINHSCFLRKDNFTCIAILEFLWSQDFLYCRLKFFFYNIAEIVYRSICNKIFSLDHVLLFLPESTKRPSDFFPLTLT